MDEALKYSALLDTNVVQSRKEAREMSQSKSNMWIGEGRRAAEALRATGVPYPLFTIGAHTS